MAKCPLCGNKIIKNLWCDFTNEAKKMGYKVMGNGEHGVIVGISRNSENYWVRWTGIQSKYSYPKEYIKLLK